MNHLSVEKVLERINQTEGFDELRSIRDQVHEMFQEHLLLSYSPELQEQINDIHDGLIKHAIFLSEKQMVGHGWGLPPVPYAFMLFGSGGRKEQTLWSDQDNGCIFADPVLKEDRLRIEEYFEKLSSYILNGLDMLGYPPCQGEVVSSNKQWRKPYSEYESMMLEWLQEPVWENVRYVLIMVDMRCVYGEASLIAGLKKQLFEYVRQHPAILQALLSNTLHHPISLGFFGQLITERYGEDAGGFDIKYGAYIPIVNGVRLLAIQAGVWESSTLERLDHLITGGRITIEAGHEWIDAFHIALKLRNRTPSQIEDGLYTTRGKLVAGQLTKELRQELKACLRAGAFLQKYVRKVVEEQIGKK
ncbi:DUF294 nucleotidyltransferase-like domain-containing protein [Paenibacillus eucommiae]|uniref:CBS domain-containing protein n=1 Tax=Paenibacillus eucommiae TaxID=1355755 RepID=A0ABS4IQI6_9BACL|nr:DUF294 nucleotidyltransferase-like domain-containing protein [Paenibacillus eucommiae]MBP1989251.1 CBS domain-containing protein [Paenibacillus eucommiae]